jgi:hypothetical protein
MLINTLLYFSIWLERIFKDKHYSCFQRGGTYLIIDNAYDRVIRDYYFYIERLFANSLLTIEMPCIIIFDCKGFSWLKFFLPLKRIVLQIEHTLVKPGARDSEGTVPGHIGILGDSGNYLVRLARFSKLSSADIVIEYSRINQFNVSKSDELSTYSSKAFCISPALYSLVADSFSLTRKRFMDTLTMFGNPNEPRRRKFLEELVLAGVKSQNVNNVFEGVEDLYRNTKILINIRQTDHHDTLEELRVLPALRCGVIVISERAPLVEITGYSRHIVWGELHELPSIVLDVQNNYEQWHRRIFNNPGFSRRMQRISRRNELVSLRAAQLINNQLLKT